MASHAPDFAPRTDNCYGRKGNGLFRVSFSGTLGMVALGHLKQVDAKPKFVKTPATGRQPSPPIFPRNAETQPRLRRKSLR